MLRAFQKATAIVIVATLFVSALAQQPSQDERIRVTTNLVQVDVVVTDSEGRQVTDLRPEDFEISEDGKRQAITNFSYIANVPSNATVRAVTPGEVGPSTGAATSSVPPAVLRPDKVRRVVTLVVDDLGISFESMNYVRKALRELVEKQMEPGDLFAILRTSGGVGALQQFTTDPRLLQAAIDNIRWLPRGRGDITPFDSSIGPTGEMMTDTYTREAVQDMQMSRNEILAAGTIATMNLVLRALQELPGRKSVVLFTENAQIIDSTGNRAERLVKLMKQMADYSNRASAVVYTVDTSGLQTLGVTAANSAGAARVFSDRIGSMQSTSVSRNPSSRNDNTVVGNPEEGLRALDNLATARRSTYFESQGVLKYLAELTGGIAIKNTNDVAGSLGRVLDDSRGYYLVGYRPAESPIDPKTGERRLLKINVKVKRPNLRVRTRSGFYGLTDEEKVAKKTTREEQLRNALNTPFAGDVRMRLTSLFGDEASGSFVRAMVYVDARDLKFTQTGDTNKADLEIVVLTLDSSGNVLDEASRIETVTAKNDGLQKILNNGLTYFLNVPVKNPGGYQVRVAVRDVASEKTGSASQYVAVPDLARGGLALSGLFVSGMSLAAATSGAKEDPNPQSGPVVRRLKRGMVLDYGYLVYNANIDKATGRPQVITQMRIFKDGAPVFTGKMLPLDITNQTDMKRLVAGGRMQLGSDMALGDYVIQVTVVDTTIKEKDKEKRRTVSQWIDFEIVG